MCECSCGKKVILKDGSSVTEETYDQLYRRFAVEPANRVQLAIKANVNPLLENILAAEGLQPDAIRELIGFFHYDIAKDVRRILDPRVRY
jgi:plasmid stabilization system protein ParE